MLFLTGLLLFLSSFLFFTFSSCFPLSFVAYHCCCWGLYCLARLIPISCFLLSSNSPTFVTRAFDARSHSASAEHSGFFSMADHDEDLIEAQNKPFESRRKAAKTLEPYISGTIGVRRKGVVTRFVSVYHNGVLTVKRRPTDRKPERRIDLTRSTVENTPPIPRREKGYTFATGFYRGRNQFVGGKNWVSSLHFKDQEEATKWYNALLHCGVQTCQVLSFLQPQGSCPPTSTASSSKENSCTPFCGWCGAAKSTPFCPQCGRQTQG